MSAINQTSDEQLYRLHKVKEITGLSRSTIYRKMEEGNFPRQIKFGRTSFWPRTAIQQWIHETINNSKGEV